MSWKASGSILCYLVRLTIHNARKNTSLSLMSMVALVLSSLSEDVYLIFIDSFVYPGNIYFYSVQSLPPSRSGGHQRPRKTCLQFRAELYQSTDSQAALEMLVYLPSKQAAVVGRQGSKPIKQRMQLQARKPAVKGRRPDQLAAFASRMLAKGHLHVAQ